MKNCLVVALSVALAVACGRTTSSNAAPNAPLAQLPTVDPNALLAHPRALSSDPYEGRGPGTKGEELTVRYLVDQFTMLGLKPGGSGGTFFQKVPLAGTPPSPAPLVLQKGNRRLTLTWKDDVVAWTKHVADSASLDQSELVFVGYGIVAPEYNWDDYK